jgi:pimeloyl-ACP methyl ester carboxylesterase
MILLGCALILGGCTYLRYTSVQQGYAAEHQAAPGQWYAKHLLGSDTYIVYGRLLETPSLHGARSLAVVAVSDRYRLDEIVDTCRLGQSSTYYGMKLPAGEFRLLVLADRNGNGNYDAEDVVAERRIRLDRNRYPDRVAGHLDIVLETADSRPSDRLIAALPRPAEPDARDSLFFPKGTIRALDDPIFSDETAVMGIYDPAAFVETAPMMFYALEEDISYKVPVVFVHGLGGSARQFAALVAGLDRTRYKPWFFHYPSGEDLDQLARLFHDIFLSGRIIPDEGAPFVIVAHSMGGLVVREAMNLGTAEDRGAPVAMIVTLASPFGGDPAARRGAANAPIVPPAWRDLDPDGPFIGGLFRRPLPSATEHQLIYAYRNRDDIARGSDGVVPLERQLPAAAMNGATRVQGFKAEHTAILTDRTAVDAITALIARVQSPLPADHLNLLRAGGFGVTLGDDYTARERFLLGTYGRYLRALANGALEPLYPEQRHFIEVMQGRAAPANDAESGWLKFRADHPGPGAAEGP